MSMMGENREKSVFVLDPCSKQCTCSHDGSDENVKCLAEITLKHIESLCNCTSPRKFEPGSVKNNAFDKVTQQVDKMVVLWNKKAFNEAAPRIKPETEHKPMEVDMERNKTDTPESLTAFKYFFEMAKFVQVDKGEGNFLIHVALEQKSVPDYVRKWEDVTTAHGQLEEEFKKKLSRRIQECPLELKDASPSCALAYGLASTFIMGYLRKKIDAIAAWVRERIEKGEKSYPKLIILVPMTGQCPNLIPGLEVWDGGKIDMICNTGGVSGRTHGTSIYKVPVVGTETYLAAIEYATPVRALYKMSCASARIREDGDTPKYLPSIGGMSYYWRAEEIKMFHSNLIDRMKREEAANLYSYKENYEIIFFDDTKYKDHGDRYDEAVKDKLREAILNVIKPWMASQSSGKMDVN